MRTQPSDVLLLMQIKLQHGDENYLNLNLRSLTAAEAFGRHLTTLTNKAKRREGRLIDASRLTIEDIL